MELKPVILAAIGLSISGLSMAACPTSVSASLTSSSTSPMTDVNIQKAINAMVNGGTLNLSGTFNISKEILLNNCIKLVTPSTISTPAVLNWVGGNGRMLNGENKNDVTLSRLRLVGRTISMGGNNVKVDQLVFDNPSRADAVNEPDLYMFKMIGGSGWTVTNNTFIISSTRTDLLALKSTGIMGWNVDKATVTGNTFNGVNADIHYQGLTNSLINSNTGKDLTWVGIEIQGTADTVYNNQVAGNAFYNWTTDATSMGLSIAGGKGYTVNNNIAVRKGYSTASCSTAKPTGTSEWGTWGMEFTGTNSTADSNRLCGFDTGIVVGINSQGSYTGVDVSTISNNIIVNSNVGIMPGYAMNNTAVKKQIVITKNQITNARNAGVADQTWWNESPHYQLGTNGNLDKLDITSNTIARTVASTEAGLTYTAISTHPVINPNGVTISGNVISLAGTPPTGFGYRGIFMDAYRDDQGVAVGQSSFVGSQVLSNTVSSTNAVWGTGAMTGKPETGKGVAFKTNTFKQLQQAINTDLAQAVVSGNTCTSVTNTSGCY